MKKSTDAKSERRRGPLQQENGSNPSSDVVAAASAVGDDAAVAAAVVGSDVADVVEVEWGCRGSWIGGRDYFSLECRAVVDRRPTPADALGACDDCDCFLWYHKQQRHIHYWDSTDRFFGSDYCLDGDRSVRGRKKASGIAIQAIQSKQRAKMIAGLGRLVDTLGCQSADWCV